MNKIKHYIYNTIFWISRLITIFIFAICFFAILNAKYVFSEQFFSVIKRIFFFEIEDLNIFIYRFDTLKQLIVYANNLEYILVLVIITFLLILFLYPCIKKFFLFYASLFCFVLYSIITFLFFNFNLTFQYFILIPLIYLIIILLNFRLTLGKVVKSLLIIPLIGDIIFINHVISYINNKINFVIRYCLVFFNINLLAILLLPVTVNFKQIYKNNENIILKGSFYSIIINDVQNTIAFNEENKRAVYVLNMLTSSFQVFNINQINTLQSVAINKKQNEYYVYDEGKGLFSVLDADSFNIKKEILLSNNFGDLISHERLFYNEYNNKTIVVLEKGKAYVTNMLKEVVEINIFDRSDSVIYNHFRNSYLISFWYNKPYITEISADDYQITNFSSPDMQGYIAISEQNKEIYIAFHQQGKIYVYNAETMKLKRKIRTQYTVKGIVYDEDLNILIAPAYFTGYVDIFLMDGSDKLLKREFVGYEVREARFDIKKENLYAVSKYGIYKKPIDVKRLIN